MADSTASDLRITCKNVNIMKNTDYSIDLSTAISSESFLLALEEMISDFGLEITGVTRQ